MRSILNAFGHVALISTLTVPVMMIYSGVPKTELQLFEIVTALSIFAIACFLGAIGQTLVEKNKKDP